MSSTNSQGKMSKTQATRLLIRTLRLEYNTTVKMIYMTVKDLTIPKGSTLLLESEVQSGVWANSAVYQLILYRHQPQVQAQINPGEQSARSKCVLDLTTKTSVLNCLKTLRKRPRGLQDKKLEGMPDSRDEFKRPDVYEVSNP